MNTDPKKIVGKYATLSPKCIAQHEAGGFIHKMRQNMVPAIGYLTLQRCTCVLYGWKRRCWGEGRLSKAAELRVPLPTTNSQFLTWVDIVNCEPEGQVKSSPSQGWKRVCHTKHIDASAGSMGKGAASPGECLSQQPWAEQTACTEVWGSPPTPVTPGTGSINCQLPLISCGGRGDT